MKKAFILFLILGTLVACDKDKFETVPKVEIKSISPDDVVKGMRVQLVATISDKEGDIKDSILVIPKRYMGTTLLSVDTFYHSLENLEIPNRQLMEIETTFTYGELVPTTYFLNLENDDTEFAVGLIVQDEAKNRSEYVESKKIILKKL